MIVTWYAMWQCHCTMLAATEDGIPDECPQHAAGLLPGVAGRRDWVPYPAPTTVLGYRSEAFCVCPVHRTTLPPFEVTA